MCSTHATWLGVRDDARYNVARDVPLCGILQSTREHVIREYECTSTTSRLQGYILPISISSGSNYATRQTTSRYLKYCMPLILLILQATRIWPRPPYPPLQLNDLSTPFWPRPFGHGTFCVTGETTPTLPPNFNYEINRFRFRHGTSGIIRGHAHIFSQFQLSNPTTRHGFSHAPSGYVTSHLVSHEQRPRAATLVNSHFSHASQNNASSCQRSQRRRLHS